MSYCLFLDDVRDPPVDNREWVIARSFTEAVNVVIMLGVPEHLSFDHDLGEDTPTGHDFAKWLIEQDLDNTHVFPEGFTFYVHSANPPGRINIQSLMESYLRTKE